MLDAVRTEVEALHEFFVDWFGGLIDNDPQIFENRFARRFADDCLLIQPGGGVADAGTFIDAVRGGYGGSPDFRIAIRNVVVRAELDNNYLLATYEEWQRNAINSKPMDNARLSSVIFERRASGQALLWRHIHETWLPPEQTPADRFDF